jgi:hypothetical protein
MSTITYTEDANAPEFVEVQVAAVSRRGIDDIIPAKFLTNAYLGYICDEAAKRGVKPGVVLADELRAHEELKTIDMGPRLKALDDLLR